jgi:hypothetical protein
MYISGTHAISISIVTVCSWLATTASAGTAVSGTVSDSAVSVSCATTTYAPEVKLQLHEPLQSHSLYICTVCNTCNWEAHHCHHYSLQHPLALAEHYKYHSELQQRSCVT